MQAESDNTTVPKTIGGSFASSQFIHISDGKIDFYPAFLSLTDFRNCHRDGGRDRLQGCCHLEFYVLHFLSLCMPVTSA